MSTGALDDREDPSLCLLLSSLSRLCACCACLVCLFVLCCVRQTRPSARTACGYVARWRRGATTRSRHEQTLRARCAGFDPRRRVDVERASGGVNGATRVQRASDSNRAAACGATQSRRRRGRSRLVQALQRRFVLFSFGEPDSFFLGDTYVVRTHSGSFDISGATRGLSARCFDRARCFLARQCRNFIQAPVQAAKADDSISSTSSFTEDSDDVRRGSAAFAGRNRSLNARDTRSQRALLRAASRANRRWRHRAPPPTTALAAARANTSPVRAALVTASASRRRHRVVLVRVLVRVRVRVRHRDVTGTNIANIANIATNRTSRRKSENPNKQKRKTFERGAFFVLLARPIRARAFTWCSCHGRAPWCAGLRVDRCVVSPNATKKHNKRGPFAGRRSVDAPRTLRPQW